MKPRKVGCKVPVVADQSECRKRRGIPYTRTEPVFIRARKGLFAASHFQGRMNEGYPKVRDTKLQFRVACGPLVLEGERRNCSRHPRLALPGAIMLSPRQIMVMVPLILVRRAVHITNSGHNRSVRIWQIWPFFGKVRERKPGGRKAGNGFEKRTSKRERERASDLLTIHLG